MKAHFNVFYILFVHSRDIYSYFTPQSLTSFHYALVPLKDVKEHLYHKLGCPGMINVLKTGHWMIIQYFDLQNIRGAWVALSK